MDYKKPWLGFVVGGMAAAIALTGCTATPSEQPPPAEQGFVLPDESHLTPQQGGTLRFGISGGGLTASNNPNNAIYSSDFVRANALYDKLADFDDKGRMEPALAESFESNADATEWTIKLRSGVLFQDRSILDADDVINTWQRILEGKWKGSNLLTVIDRDKTKAVDDLTVKVVLNRPVAIFPEFLAADGMYILKKGFTDFQQSNGTGAFDLVSWTPTDRAVLKRKDGYWRGPAFVDTLEIVELTDVKAGATALRDGQINVLSDVATEDVKNLSNADGVYIATQVGAVASNFYMRVDKEPLDDPNVRRAMKLSIDREGCLNNAAGGVGSVGNDLPGPASEYYASDLPQRTFDPEAARKLLQKSGLDEVTVTLTVGPADPVMLACAQVFQQSAKQAGINIEIKTIPAQDNWNRDAGYLQRDMGMSSYNGTPLVSFIPGFLLSNAHNNDTHLADPAFDAKYWEAVGTVDDGKRTALFKDLQHEMWDTGGHIIWGLTGRTFGLTSNVHGAQSLVSPNPGLTSSKRLDKLWLER